MAGAAPTKVPNTIPIMTYVIASSGIGCGRAVSDTRLVLATAQWPLARAPHLLETSLPGVFAVGDVRSGNVKRVASAVGEGSIAVSFVHQVHHE